MSGDCPGGRFSLCEAGSELGEQSFVAHFVRTMPVGDRMYASPVDRREFWFPYWTERSYEASCALYRVAVCPFLDDMYPSLATLTRGSYGVASVLDFLVGLFRQLERVIGVPLEWLRHPCRAGRGVPVRVAVSWSSALGAFYLRYYTRDSVAGAKRSGTLLDGIDAWNRRAGIQVVARDVVDTVIEERADRWSYGQVLALYAWCAVQTLGVLAEKLGHRDVRQWCCRVQEEVGTELRRLFC